MNIPESAIEPFGVIGIPLLKLDKVSPYAITQAIKDEFSFTRTPETMVARMHIVAMQSGASWCKAISGPMKNGKFEMRVSYGTIGMGDIYILLAFNEYGQIVP